MDRKFFGRRIGFFVLAALAFSAQACMMSDYYGSGPSADASSLDGEAWTLSSTASPHYLRDDALSGGFGKTAIYSYAHTAKGQRIALAPGESRGVYRTSRGSVIAVSLGVRIGANGGTSSFIYLANFTDWDRATGETYEINQRGTFTPDLGGGSPVSVSLIGGPSGTKIEIRVDGETMRMTVDDLYRWRLMKMIEGGADTVHFGPNAYYIMASAGEDNTLPVEDSFGVAQVFFKAGDLFDGNNRREPDFAVLIKARGQRISDRIPIRGSGFELVWDPSAGQYIINGPGGSPAAPAAAPAQRAEGVTFGSPRAYRHSSGRFTVDIPSNWQIDDLTKDPKNIDLRANDPTGYAWLHIHVIEAGESLSRADLESALMDWVFIDWDMNIFDFSLDTPLAVLDDGGLGTTFQGFRRNPDMAGRGLDNQILGSVLIKQRNGIVAIIGLDMMKSEWETKRDNVTAIYQSLRIAGFRP